MTEGFEGKVVSKRPISAHILLVTVAVVPPSFTFQAGQYINLDLKLPNGESGRKPFSIASAPSRGNVIEILVKLTPGKLASEFFQRAESGTTFTFSGPYGAITVPSKEYSLHLIGAGVGIAPLRSINHHLIENNYKASIRLSVLRDEPWPGLDEEFATWFQGSGNFSYTLVHAGPTQLSDPAWQWRHLAFGDPQHDELIYLFGPKPFIEGLLRELRARGFAQNRIITENA